MLTDWFEIGNDFEVDFEVDFRVDFEVDFGLFVLHFPGSHFYEFLVEKKKNHAQHSQIETVVFELVAKNYRLFGFAFYLTTQRVDLEVLPQGVFLFLEGEGLVEVKD